MDSYTRCKDGWIYAPDGFGCVQIELCPVCDGDGFLKKKSKFDVTLQVTFERNYTVEATDEQQAIRMALRTASRLKRSGEKVRKGFRFLSAVAADVKTREILRDD